LSADALICAAQHDAFQQEIRTVYEDLHAQEIRFGREAGPRGTMPSASPEAIDCNAAQAAAEDIAQIPPEKRWSRFKEMGLGVAGRARRTWPGARCSRDGIRAPGVLAAVVGHAHHSSDIQAKVAVGQESGAVWRFVIVAL